MGKIDKKFRELTDPKLFQCDKKKIFESLSI